MPGFYSGFFTCFDYNFYFEIKLFILFSIQLAVLKYTSPLFSMGFNPRGDGKYPTPYFFIFVANVGVSIPNGIA